MSNHLEHMPPNAACVFVVRPFYVKKMELVIKATRAARGKNSNQDGVFNY